MEIKITTEIEEVSAKTLKAFALIAVINALFLWISFGVMS